LDPLFVPEMQFAAHGIQAAIQNSTALGMKGIILEKFG
jgi:hypothetical protein